MEGNHLSSISSTSPHTNVTNLGNPTFQSSTSVNPILQSTSSLNGDSEQTYKLSCRRWLVLVAISVFGLTIALSDVTSPILTLYLKLLDLDIQQYLYLQPIFYYVMMALAFPTALLVDKYGLKMAMHTSAGLFVLHGLLRALVFYPDLPHHSKLKFSFYIISSMVGVEMMTIFFLLPLKASETWFSSKERTVAWAFMSAQMNVGICFASFVYPRIVKKIEDFSVLAYITVGCCIVTALTSFTLITRSLPEYPPSERAIKESKKSPIPYRQSLLRMITHRDIVIHLVHLATFESVTLCFGSVLQPILGSIGYDSIFTGNLLSANSLITIFMQIFMAFFVHKVKNPTLICKFGSLVQGVLFVLNLLTIIIVQRPWILVASFIILTLCKAWVTPNFTNMTAHLACGTVSQATIVGFSMFLTVLIMTVINFIFTKFIVIIGADTQSYNYSLIFLGIVTLVNEIFYLGFFRGQQAIIHEDDEEQPTPRGTESNDRVRITS